MPVRQRFHGCRGFAALFIVAATVFFSTACRQIADRIEQARPEPAATPSEVQEDPNLLLGNPSDATPDPANKDNYLLQGKVFTLSYNSSKGTMNWVAWRTTRADLGKRLERPDFMPDPRLPAGFNRVNYSVYSGSGYERGHMVPSADRFADREQNLETFYMTNIVPQTTELNQFVWNKLELYARALARRRNDVYTIAGTLGEQGRLRGKVSVPNSCWKIIVVLPPGGGPEDINANTRVIAVDIPNISGIRYNNWRQYRTTVRELEQRTGYDFFELLPRELQDVLETRQDTR